MTEIWPVIHLSDDIHTTTLNAVIAARCGCPGVFLIAMDGNDANIVPHAKAIRQDVPSLKIGANWLSMDPGVAVRRSVNEGYDATWSDYAWQNEDVPLLDDHDFFAAVAFKGETHNEARPDISARKAVERGFIPMTSGGGTGVTAPISKIMQLRNALYSDAPLAMSGVYPPHADKLAQFVTHMLVATCISHDFYRFDERRLRYLANKVSPNPKPYHGDLTWPER